MWLKPTILIVFIALVISLVSAFYFLVKDQGGPSRRLLHSLGIRVTLAILLIGLIGYGMMTGQLKSQAPWAHKNAAQETIEQP